MVSATVSSGIGSTDATARDNSGNEKPRTQAIGDLENQENSIQNDDQIRSETPNVSEESNAVEKDFPDLAPSKSMDFPDGTLHSHVIIN